MVIDQMDLSIGYRAVILIYKAENTKKIIEYVPLKILVA